MIFGFDGSRAFSDKRTGTENYSYQLLKNLAKIDKKNIYKVFLRPNTVILSETKDLLRMQGTSNQLRDSSATPQNDNEEWPENFQFITIPWERLWTQVGLSLKTFTEDLDVLFVPAHTLPIIHKKGLKTVVTVHDLGSEYLPKTHQLKQRLYLGLMQKFQLKVATKLIAVSKATKQDLIQRIGIPPEKIKVVYEGLNKELYKPISAKGRSSSGRKIDKQRDIMKYYGIEKERYFLFVGTVQPRKNLARLIEAFTILTRGPAGSQPQSMSSTSLRALIGAPRSPSPLATNLVIVGKKGWMADEIYALPKKLGIEEKIKFLDYIKDTDLPALYSGAIALVFPSLFEGFGLPILEAQACGCPVVTSNLSSMPEIAGGGAILVDPYSVDDIVSSMRKIENRKLRMEIVKEGFKNVKRFSWEKCAEQTLKILEGVSSRA